MKIETILTPAELPALAQRDLRATACVVFDVLRATSTFVTALQNGAKAIIPVSEIAEAIAIKNSKLKIKNLKSILLGGERHGVRISDDGIDFDLGNSPREYTPEIVRGKTIISTTTNGTRALRACVGARTILAASFLNLTATAEFLRQNNFENVLLVCAGTGENQADEDVLAAGALCELLEAGRAVLCPPSSVVSTSPSPEASDGAHGVTRPTLADSTQVAQRAWQEAQMDWPTAVWNSENARRLLAIPELRDDVAFCLQRDVFPLVARMEADGAIRAGQTVASK